jgi:hypothetical protein
MAAEDWSASTERFQLADAMIRDDYNRAMKIAQKLGKSDEYLTKNAYREWPLFRDFRKQPAFATTFESVFGEPLNRVRVRTDQDETKKDTRSVH